MGTTLMDQGDMFPRVGVLWEGRLMDKVVAEYGMAQAKGVHVFFALNPNRCFPVLATQGIDVEDTPEAVTALIAKHRSMGNDEPFIIVVNGDHSFCMSYRQGMFGADAVVYVSHS